MDSDSVKLGKSVINALTIVGVICAATFVVVLLYKFRCMRVGGIRAKANCIARESIYVKKETKNKHYSVWLPTWLFPV